MSQTTVQNEDSIRLGNGVLKVNGVNVGILKDASLEVERITAQIAGHNGKLPPREKIQSVKFKATLMEIHLVNLKQIFGGDLAVIVGTPVVITDEAHGIGWVVGKPIQISSKNGANTEVASIVVKAGAGTLTNNTDYDTYVGDGTNGELGYTYIVPLTAQTLAITVSYSYTPSAKNVLTYDDLIRTIATYPVEFINTDVNGKEYGVRIFKGYATNSLAFTFPSDDDIEATLEIPVEFGAYVNENNQFFEIIDEQAV